MQRAIRHWLAVAAGVLACAAGAANAKDNKTYHAGAVAIQLEDWTLTPVVYEDAGAWKVHSLLAINQGAMFNAPIQAVWYIKDPSSDCLWYAKTWATTDPWDAIKTIKYDMAISDNEDENWAIGFGPTPFSTVKPKLDYSKGFQADDAAGREINTYPDRDQWVSWLVDIGYPAADVKFERAVESTDPAYPSTVLNQYALAAANLLTQTAPPPPPPPGPGAPPTPVIPIPTAPGVPPVVPGSLPGGPSPAPYTPPPSYCCTPGTIDMWLPWSGYMVKGGWTGPVNCGTSNGHPACCEYTQTICRYRQQRTVTITCSPPTFTYTLKTVQESCWERKVKCDAVEGPGVGAWSCLVTGPVGAPNCDQNLAPPLGPPPPTTPSLPPVNYP